MSIQSTVHMDWKCSKSRNYAKTLCMTYRKEAAARMNDLSYSRLMHGLKLANIAINRKMLSEMAIHDAEGFTKLCEEAKAALNA